MSRATSQDDALRRLAEVDPGPERVERWGTLDDEAFLEHVVHDNGQAVAGEMLARRGQAFRWRRIAVGGAVASIALLVAFALLPASRDGAPRSDLPRPSGDPSEPRFSSPLAALTAAAAAASLPEPVQSGPVRYIHLLERDSDLLGKGAERTRDGAFRDGPRYVAYNDRETETWFRPDGTRYVRGTSSGGYPSREDERLGEAERDSGHTTPFGPSQDFNAELPAPRSSSSPDRLGFYLLKPKNKSLPTDPDKLAAVFASVRADSTSAGAGEDSPEGDAVQTFDYASQLLLDAPFDRKLRAAAFQVVANLDLVELEGRVRDPLGRLGTAVTFDAAIDEERGAGTPLTRYSLIFDADTSEPLAYVKEQLDAPSDTGSPVVDYTVLVDSGRAEAVDQRPSQ